MKMNDKHDLTGSANTSSELMRKIFDADKEFNFLTSSDILFLKDIIQHYEFRKRYDIS